MLTFVRRTNGHGKLLLKGPSTKKGGELRMEYTFLADATVDILDQEFAAGGLESSGRSEYRYSYAESTVSSEFDPTRRRSEGIATSALPSSARRHIEKTFLRTGP